MVRDNTTIACVDHRGDHLPIEIGPRRLAVNEERYSSARRPLVNVVCPQPIPLKIIWRKRKIGEIREVGIVRSNDFKHGPFLLGDAFIFTNVQLETLRAILFSAKRASQRAT